MLSPSRKRLVLILLGPEGGPDNRGMVPGLYMFREAFYDQRYGYACALGMVMFFILLGITILASIFLAQAIETGRVHVKGRSGFAPDEVGDAPNDHVGDTLHFQEARKRANRPFEGVHAVRCFSRSWRRRTPRKLRRSSASLGWRIACRCR